jgi:uncharacterized protein (DUF2164 family)
MDACESVEREIEKVISKFTGIKEQSSNEISEIVSMLTVYLASLSKFDFNIISHCRSLIVFLCLSGNLDSNAATTEQQTEELKNVIKKCRSKVQAITSDHRTSHAAVSKVGKAIDRHFIPDYESITPLDLFESEKILEILNQIIAEHFYRQGMNEVADSLVTESQLPPEEDIHLELFADLYQMWEAITNRNLGPGNFESSHY